MKIKKIPIFSMGELASLVLEKPEEFWNHRILAQGYRVLIAGAPKVGKSDFFLELATRAASGGMFLGKAFSRPLKVLYLQSEINQAYLHERVHLFERSFNQESLNLIGVNFYFTERLVLNLMSDKDWNKLHQTLLYIKPDIVAFDPIISFSDIDENSSREVSRLLYDRIGRLQNALIPAPAVILIHHLRKSTEQGGDSIFSSIRGSSAWLGWYDTGILLTRCDEGVLLHYDTRNQGPPPPQHIVLNRKAGQWQIQKISAPQLSDKVRWAINVVQESPKPLSSNHLKNLLISNLNIRERMAYKIIAELKKHSCIRFIESGRNLLFTYQNEGI